MIQLEETGRINFAPHVFIEGLADYVAIKGDLKLWDFLHSLEDFHEYLESLDDRVKKEALLAIFSALESSFTEVD